MSEAMSAEFDTVAEWTAEAAVRLGPPYFLPAGCRGSGSPAALDWLVEHLGLTAGEMLLDCGAGVGGPAAYAAEQRSVEPVLVEPEAGACRAARRLFESTVIQASATALPFPDAVFDAAWSLGVLCTVTDQLALLTELRRTVRPPARIGLLVFVSISSTVLEKPEGNNFPDTEVLSELVTQAGLRIEARRHLSDVAPARPDWQRREEAVEAELRKQHGHERGWQLAEHQSDLVARLLNAGAVRGELLSLRSR